MDLATIGGIIFGFSMLISAFLVEGGTMGSLVAPTAFLIVFGGTIGATATSFSMAELKTLPSLFKEAFVERHYDMKGLIEEMVQMANKARREGLLTLEQSLKDIPDTFLQRGLQMVIDGVEGTRLREMMETEIYCSKQRDKVGIEIFAAAGGYAPTMGIVGTVMGLVNVLGNMENPNELGPAIAVAFLATLYGIASANLLWLPISNKLKVRSKDQILYKELALEGIMSLQSGEASALMKEKMLAFVDEKQRDIFRKEA